ncbi:hypothetical protein [Micromonospora haikouensis]|uniref:hypothetical protein n=1 Tax=Micromonospora haikouensis TaxID=686309 RepID=UPI003D763591
MPTTTRIIPEGTVQLEYKSAVTGSLLGHDDEQGIVEALVSITGIADEQDDIVVPGAYTKTLAKRRMKGVRFHDWARPVAKTLVQEEWLPGDERLPKALPNGDPWPVEAGALYVKGQYNLAVQDGRDAYETAKFFGPDGQWSIGYRPAPGGARRDQKSGKRLLHEVDLFEWSDVLHGAAPLSTTLGVKTAGPGGAVWDAVDGAGRQPEGFVAGLDGKTFDPSQPRAGDGKWSDTGGGGAAPAGAGPGGTRDGLPKDWLERVLAGDPKFVKPSGGGGGGKKGPKEGSSELEKARAAEMDRRDRVDQALQDEQAAERKRRADAHAKIQSYTGGERRRLQQEEDARRMAWQETFDAARDEERSRRRQWNAEQRRRKAAAKSQKDQFGGGLGWDADLTGLDDGDSLDEKMFGSVEPAAGGPVDDVEVKVMDVLAGSFEERRERLRAAAEALLGGRPSGDSGEGVWVYLAGTWNDRVVAVRHGGAGEPQTFEIPYSIRDGEVELGAPVEVEIVSTIVPTESGGGTKGVAALVLDDAARMLALDAVAEKSGGAWTAEDELLASALDRVGALVTGAPVETAGKDQGGVATKTTGEPDGTARKVQVDPDEITKMLAQLG